MYQRLESHQITFEDFNQSCGMQLAKDNEWIVLGDHFDWRSAETSYAKNFPAKTGHAAAPLRQVLGALIIQKRMKLSDRALVKAIAENPYYQYFIGLTKFARSCPFKANSLVAFRKRLGFEMLIQFNDEFLKTAPATPEHSQKGSTHENIGTMILDATCSPSNIRYPQDFSLLNEAREKTDGMIDILHKQFEEGHRPRTYRRVLRTAYLSMAKSKKRSATKIRSLIRKLLCALKRNLDFVAAYLKKGGKLAERRLVELETIQELYRQQKQMFDEKNHRVDNRIVSIEQPHIRPVVRGKAKAPVEFGAKYDVSIDEKGHARLEKISFDPYNECTVFQDAIERYKNRTGRYPVRALVDKIYRTKENRNFCKERGIHMSGRAPGRPANDKAETLRERKNETDRIEVERFFSVEKRCCGAGMIMTKLANTTLTSIALSVLVANLFGVGWTDFLCLYLSETEQSDGTGYFMEFYDTESPFATTAECV